MNPLVVVAVDLIVPSEANEHAPVNLVDLPDFRRQPLCFVPHEKRVERHSFACQAVRRLQ